MKSIYRIFENEWGNRSDFPIALDIKYFLLHTQSRLLANDAIHPMLYPVHDKISSFYKKITERTETNLFKQFGEDLSDLTETHFEYEVTIQIFNICLPDIFAYLIFIEQNYGRQFFTNEMPGINERDYPFYVWQQFTGLWIPINNHAVIKKYLDKYEKLFGLED